MFPCLLTLGSVIGQALASGMWAEVPVLSQGLQRLRHVPTYLLVPLPSTCEGLTWLPHWSKENEKYTEQSQTQPHLVEPRLNQPTPRQMQMHKPHNADCQVLLRVQWLFVTLDMAKSHHFADEETEASRR